MVRTVDVQTHIHILPFVIALELWRNLIDVIVLGNVLGVVVDSLRQADIVLLRLEVFDQRVLVRCFRRTGSFLLQLQLGLYLARLEHLFAVTQRQERHFKLVVAERNVSALAIWYYVVTNLERIGDCCHNRWGVYSGC